eukprot:Colp12_sorted_trinity150504_noHs@30953
MSEHEPMVVDDDDPVVHEVDIFVSQTLSKNLFVFQFPLRAPNAPYDTGAAELKARIKPIQQKIELEIPLDTASENYDREKGEQFAAAADPEGVAPGAYNEKKLEKQILASRRVPETASYCVGVLTGDSLHLTPVHGVCQMRPSFYYLDEADNVKKMKAKKQAEEEAAAADELQEPEAEAVKLTFKRKETEVAAAARKRTYGFIQKICDAEPWTELNFYPQSSDAADIVFKRLFCTRSDDVIPMELNASEYLQALNPVIPESERQLAPPATTRPLSLHELRQKPLEERVAALMKNVHTLQFATLVEVVDDPKATEEALLTLLEQCADFIQGHWIVHSEMVYPPSFQSPHSLIKHAHLITARNHLLARVHFEGHMPTRKELMDEAKLPMEDAHDMLAALCVFEEDAGWSFKVPVDSDFIARFPEVVARQHAKVDQKFRQQSGEADVECVSAPSTKQGSVVSVSTTVTGASVEEQLLNFISEVFRLFNVCTLTQFKKQLAIKQSVSQSHNLLHGVKDSMLVDAIKRTGSEVEVSYPLPGGETSFYMLRNIGPQLDKYRDVMVGMYKTRASFKKADITNTLKEHFGDALSTASYSKVLKQLAVSRGSIWTLKCAVATN